MNQFKTLVKKEIFEFYATKKVFILVPIFVALGIFAPVMAWFIPIMFEAFEAAGMGDFGVMFSESTALDSWSMFFGNVGGEMGLGTIAFLVMYCGTMASEFSKGTMINLLTKGLKRPAVILSKFVVGSAVWTVCYLVAIGVCWLITSILWDAAVLNHVFLAFTGPWLFGIFVLALLIFGGTFAGQIYGPMVCFFGMMLSVTVLSFITPIARFNPGALGLPIFSLLVGAEPSDFIPAFIVTAVLIVLLIAASLYIFNRKKV